MATNILSVGTTTANSSDITLADGEMATLALKDADEHSLVFIQIKDDAGSYEDFKQLGKHNSPLVVNGGCTFRVRRLAGPAAGVYRG